MDPMSRLKHGLDGMDGATAALILQIQEEDIEYLASENKGKGIEDVEYDAEFALLTYQRELRESRTKLSDQRMCQSLTQAVVFDAIVLYRHTAEERRATFDRALADALKPPKLAEVYVSGKGDENVEQDFDDAVTDVDNKENIAKDETTSEYDDSPVNDDNSDDLRGDETASECDDVVKDVDSGKSIAEDEPIEEYDDTTFDKIFGDIESDKVVEAVSPALDTPQIYVMRSHKRSCVACNTNVPASGAHETPCGDHYCYICLSTLFQLSTTDESLYPPQCCQQPIPLDTVRAYLTDEILRTYESKSIEYETMDKTYCSQTECGTFIPPASITCNTAKCPTCNLFTCVVCKKDDHLGNCPDDAAIQEVLDMAKDQKWQRCPNCRAMTCECPQWSEANLLIDRDTVQALENAAAVLAEEESDAEESEADDVDCTHDEGWTRIDRGNECEICENWLAEYIFECDGCQMLACARCRRNEL
ncbi:uncharacterized protein KY384_003603 [Bacidia gigantensis]|uniref:uncharacterized protein n=1 Tax=Bacidia gigantensis TaxID=2732470 RepID=UPI001D0594BE|nr:uncharacterized protein KY384_003603 [Bacidia gigantensis]KAG8531967.1 hypothetical protein KY384_003603 [Bacidia gigantensis]